MMRTRSGYRSAVLLIAVDRYKIITDTLGHTAGDELMVQVTRLFNQVLAGGEHVLARWADDELARCSQTPARWRPSAKLFRRCSRSYRRPSSCVAIAS